MLATAVCISSMAALAGACSVDISELRRPTQALPDGGVDVGQAGSGADAAVADVPSAPLDSSWDAEQAPPDRGRDVLPQAGRDGLADIRDVPPVVEVDSDSPSTRDASLGDVGLGEDAPAHDTGADQGQGTGGADGGLSAAGGATGSGGTSGLTTSGGTTGSGGTGGLTTSGGATGSGGTGGLASSGGAVVDPDLVLWYTFDESSGTVAADSSPSGLDGKLATTGVGGSATFSTDCRVGTHALRLTPGSNAAQSGGYVTTPAPASLAPDAITITLWVKLASEQTWARLFDFGTGTGATHPYLYMTTRTSETSNPRFGITEIGRGVGGVQRLDGPSPLSLNAWHHIAVVLPSGRTYSGRLYIDGVLVATNDDMTVHPSGVGVTTDNWLGRSPTPPDPFLSGWLDDFRIYKRALSAAEITSLMALR